MESLKIIELIGYIASVILVISMMMSSLVKLRIVNMTGAFLFSVYGFLISAYPVGILNGLIVFVNLYQLYKLFNRNEEFRIIQLPVKGDLVSAFIEHYKKDIKHYQPDFDYDVSTLDTCVVTLRNMNIAGVVLGVTDEMQSLTIKLDFVIPQYRDTKVGQYLFVLNKQYFKTKGYIRIIATGKNKQHIQYLRGVGFLSLNDDNYELKL